MLRGSPSHLGFVKAAEQDLEKQMQAREKPAKEVADVKHRPDRNCERRSKRTRKEEAPKEAPPVRRMIEDVKKEEESGQEEENDECDPDGPLELEDGELEGDEETGAGEASQSGSEAEESDDNDLFNDEFSIAAPKGAKTGDRFDGLPEGLRKQASRLSKELLGSLPAEMTATLAWIMEQD